MKKPNITILICYMTMSVILSACGSQTITASCSTVHTWTKPELAELLKIVQGSDPKSILIPVLNDYQRMRAEARVCAA